MLIIQVALKVRNDSIERFMELTRNNVENSRKEQGIERFDLYRETDTGNVFILFEIYKTKDDQIKHRETEHFKGWKANITDLLEEPYNIKQYELVE